MFTNDKLQRYKINMLFSSALACCVHVNNRQKDNDNEEFLHLSPFYLSLFLSLFLYMKFSIKILITNSLLKQHLIKQTLDVDNDCVLV